VVHGTGGTADAELEVVRKLSTTRAMSTNAATTKREFLT
jgi:hypothetical protein